MRTFRQIQEDVFTQLKEDVGDNGFWTINEVKNAINDIYLFIADETLCFRFQYIIEVKANIRTYKLPSYYIAGSINRVEFDNKIIFPTTAQELDELNRSWRNSSGSDITAYLLDICESDEISVYPLPDTDGPVYNTANGDAGVIVAVGDDSQETFDTEVGAVVATNEEADFEGGGEVMDIRDSTNNLRVFGAKYPKRLIRDDEVFLHPISENPRRILTIGSLSLLFSKEGEGKDIAKASYYNKRFEETMARLLERPKIRRMHKLKSIYDSGYHGLNLGEHYPSYIRR